MKCQINNCGSTYQAHHCPACLRVVCSSHDVDDGFCPRCGHIDARLTFEARVIAVKTVLKAQRERDLVRRKARNKGSTAT